MVHFAVVVNATNLAVLVWLDDTVDIDHPRRQRRLRRRDLDLLPVAELAIAFFNKLLNSLPIAVKQKLKIWLHQLISQISVARVKHDFLPL